VDAVVVAGDDPIAATGRAKLHGGMRRILRFFAESVFLAVVLAIGVPVLAVTVILGSLLFLPLPATIPQPKLALASQPSHVYDINGNEIATFRQFEQNIPVDKKDIPPILKEAVISVEDRNYYHHGGVDVRGTLRAFVADFRSKKAVQGGSTITQQYVKNAYTGGKRTLVRKVKEAILASRLGRATQKDEILFRYLSSIYLGDGAYGVGAASESYFRKPVSQLSLSEAATLAGLIPAPSAWAPRENPDAAEVRRQLVLDKMLQQGYLTPAQHDQALTQHVWLAAKGTPPPSATVVYPLQQEQPQFPDFVDYVQRYLIAKYGPELVFRGGLRVQTTMDPKIQNAALQAVQQGLAHTGEPLEMALAAVEPQTGFVKALVGGRQFGQGPYASVNFALGGCEPQPGPSHKVDVPATCWNGANVTGGGAGRQPGSAWKPFVLATAFSKGYTPSRVYSGPTVYHIPNCSSYKPGDCDIHNNEGEGGGSYDLRHATWLSVNTVYAQLIRDVGCKDTAEMAKKLGIKSAWYSPDIHTCSGTYALGEVGVSPLDMASAYGVFDDHGVRAEPTPIVKIVDVNNHTLEDNIAAHPPATQVLDPVIADNVTDVLRGVIQSGTGTAANIGRPAAGKTGTTSGPTNAWFTGYTPSLSTSVWMGYANNQTTSLRNIHGFGVVYGGTIPAITWHNFMAEAVKDVPPTDFNQPAPIQTLADQLKAQQRQGISPAPRFYLPGTPEGGPYQVPPTAPPITPPSTSTSLPEATTTLFPTTTTKPGKPSG
jgi:penicillin-binding protein 1A